MGGRDDYEIILVNDTSPDHTLERMQALAEAESHIRILDNPVNLGFGGSYKRGAKAASATSVMMRICWWKLASLPASDATNAITTMRNQFKDHCGGCTTKSAASAHSIKVTATNNGIKPRTHQVDTRRQ
jgi:hypothetical protein